MALSIKNEEVERLVRTLSKETGKGVTEIILSALKVQYEKQQRAKHAPSLYEEVLDIAQRCGNLPTLDMRSPEEILGYDDQGGLQW